MTKESGSHNTDISRKVKGILDFPDGKRVQGLGENEAKPETSVIFSDGIKLAGLTKLRKNILQLLIDRSLNGESVSKTELKEVYEADGVRKAGKDSIADFIVRLNGMLKNRNLSYTIENLTSRRETPRGIEASYFFTTSDPTPETASPENPDIEPESHKNKIQLSKEAEKKIQVRLAVNILSAMAEGQTNRLNGLVNIHIENAARSQGATFLDIFRDMSQDEVKSSFIGIIGSAIETYWDFNTKNPSPEEIELAKQCIRLKKYHTREGVIQELCRYFDIPVPEKYIL